MTKKADHPFKSSNMPFMMKVFFSLSSFVFKTLDVISPRLAGKLALRIFMTPPKSPTPQRESKVREQANLNYRMINGNKIALRVWGNKSLEHDAPTILLSHGWAGRTSQFLEFIDPLVDAGYRVVGADIPAHGDSPGKQTNMLESSQLLSTIADEFGPLSAIIGHSFGTGTILLGMDKYGIESPKIVLIGAYSRVSFILDMFKRLFNLNQATMDAMQQAGYDKFGDAYGIDWDWESISPVNTIKSYEGKVFFIHDETDHEVPMNEALEIHKSKPDAKILISSGFGHRRILRKKEVIDEVIEFIKE